MILHVELMVLPAAKLRVLAIAVGMLTASIGITAPRCPFRGLPAGAVVGICQDSFVGFVRLSTLFAD